MSSQQQVDNLSAEARFRQSFERLKTGQPKVLKRGSSITQNNVAREAGCDPSALKKARFPALIREIQAYLELHTNDDQIAARQAKRQNATKRSDKERLQDAIRQRDQAQSILASANLRIIELTSEVQVLRRRLDELQPPLASFAER